MSDKITVEAKINAPISKVWDYYTNVAHVAKWNHASEDWHSPADKSVNDLRVGGSFVYRMEPINDPEGGFDFGGTYTEVEDQRVLKYTMDDGRTVEVEFEQEDDGHTEVEVKFDPETENEPEFQRQGWQAILDNFKAYVEGN